MSAAVAAAAASVVVVVAAAATATAAAAAGPTVNFPMFSFSLALYSFLSIKSKMTSEVRKRIRP